MALRAGQKQFSTEYDPRWFSVTAQVAGSVEGYL